MSVPSELLEILACPRCKGRLQTTRDGSLGCPRCAVAYAVTDDIPVMIVEEAVPWVPESTMGRVRA